LFDQIKYQIIFKVHVGICCIIILNYSENSLIVRNVFIEIFFISRKPLFKYCYECGRSVGVRLSACTRCKEIYYCGKACKLRAWNARHKEECIRVGGRSNLLLRKYLHIELYPSHTSTSISHISKTQIQYLRYWL